MFGLNFEKTDRNILLVAICCLVISSGLLLDDSWLFQLGNDSDQLEHIGDIEVSEKDVRRRHKTNFTWTPIKVGSNVYQGDSIYTGKDSIAKIITQKGEEIRVAANSLVVINSKADGINLDISFGSVKGRVDKGKKLTISNNNTITELTGSNALIEVDAGSGENVVVNVIEGEVNLKTNNGTQLLRKNQVKTLTPENTVEDFNKIEFITPVTNTKIRTGVNDEIDFVWTSKKPLKNIEVKVALDKDFTKVLYKSNSEMNKKQIRNLPKDKPLYWQVTSKESKSDISQFVIVGDIPPDPVYPKTGEHLYFDRTQSSEQGLDVNLVWEANSYAENFEVQISNNQYFDNIIKTISSKDSSTFTGKLMSGEYYWRVKSSDFPGLDWSEVAYFNIGDAPMKKIAPPPSRMKNETLLLLTKNNNLSTSRMLALDAYKRQQYVKKFPIIKWAPIANATDYKVEISRSAKFADPLVSITVQKPYFIWRQALVGNYYWRVRANTPKYTVSTASEARFFKVRLAPPASKTKEKFVEEVEDLAFINVKPAPFPLNWNATVFTKKYEVEFAANPAFKNALRFVTQKNSKPVAVDRPGTFYWRVRSIGLNNLPISKFSDTYTISFMRTYKPPKSSGMLMTLTPAHKESVIAVGKGSNDIRFTWSNPFGKSNYRIEIATDDEFKNITHSHLTNSNEFSLKTKPKTGFYYWRVRAENSLYTSSWTTASQVFLATEKIPFDYKFSEELFYARLRARKRQEILAEKTRRDLLLQRSPAANVDTRLASPTPINPISHFIIKSKFDQTVSWKTLATQPYNKFYEQIQSSPTFRWNKVQNAERYVLEIAKDKEFEKTVTKYPTIGQEFTWENVVPGRYYWRVQAFNDKYSRSYYGPVTELLVETETPKTISPDTIFELTDLAPSQRLQPAPFKLEWTPVVFARAYQVELSDKMDFSSSSVYNIDKTYHNFKVTKSGTYFWRVRPVNRLGIGVGPYSRARAIEIAVAQRSPASISALTGLFPSNNRTLIFIGKGIMNLALSWLSPYKNKIGQYVVELSQSQSFDQVFARYDANNTQTVIKEELPEGQIYWRIGYKVNGKVESWSETNKFNLKRERESYDFKANIP